MKMNDARGLPPTWSTAKISEISTVNPPLDKSGIPDNLEVSFVPMPAVQAETGVIDVSGTRRFADVRKGYTAFREGDILFAKITPCMENGKMAVVPEVRNGIGFGSTEFHVLRSLPGIDEQYVYYYVSSKAFRYVAEHNMTGAVGQRRVPTPYLSACAIPIPPTSEQHRIVAKIEEMFSELDKGIESLKTAQAQLKVYRQALLKHAFEGKLTAAWREQNRDNLESAAALLQHIQQERAERYRQQLAAWETGGKQGGKPKAPKILPPLTVEDLAELPELPEGWGWVRLGDLASLITKGASPKWQGINYVDDTSQVLFVTSENVRENYIDVSMPKYVEHGFNKKQPSSCLEFGDLLVNIVGASIGRAALFNLIANANVNQAVSVVRIPTVELRQYISLLLNTHFASIYYEKNAVDVARANLSLVDVANIPVPLCSLIEINEIQEEVESRLSEVDQLEQTLVTSLQQAEALRRSILKRAFSGQLVPQDPNDQPASALLERIKAERQDKTKTDRRRRKVV